MPFNEQLLTEWTKLKAMIIKQQQELNAWKTAFPNKKTKDIKFYYDYYEKELKKEQDWWHLWQQDKQTEFKFSILDENSLPHFIANRLGSTAPIEFTIKIASDLSYQANPTKMPDTMYSGGLGIKHGKKVMKAIAEWYKKQL